MTVREYIRNNWKNSVKKPDTPHKGIVKMPTEYTVPCMREGFTDFYYWDTYFTNVGLLLDGDVEQTRKNLDTMAYFIDALGYVPNASNILDRSQPPLFVRGVFDLWRATGDDAVLTRYMKAMEAEYRFFMLDRMTPCGLNAYGTGLCRARLLLDYPWLSERVGHFVEDGDMEGKIALSRDLFSIAESGWDFNYRFRTERSPFDARAFAHLDLCSLLFDVEQKLALMKEQLGDSDAAARYRAAAEHRRSLMDTYMRDPQTGIYYDYNFVSGVRSDILSAASIYPYAVGISDDQEGLLATLRALELPCGLGACAYRGEGERYLQWDFPSMWPSNVYFAYVALHRLGLDADARRIGEKYIHAVDAVYRATGDLFEKYDARDGSVSVTSEYETPAMLGWTAGVYAFLKDNGL